MSARFAIRDTSYEQCRAWLDRMVTALLQSGATLHRRDHYASRDFNPVEDALLRKTASLTFPAMLMNSPEWQDQRDAYDFSRTAPTVGQPIGGPLWPLGSGSRFRVRPQTNAPVALEDVRVDLF